VYNSSLWLLMDRKYSARRKTTTTAHTNVYITRKYLVHTKFTSASWMNQYLKHQSVLRYWHSVMPVKLWQADLDCQVVNARNLHCSVLMLLKQVKEVSMSQLKDQLKLKLSTMIMAMEHVVLNTYQQTRESTKSMCCLVTNIYPEVLSPLLYVMSLMQARC